jgi:hypothetical protein
MDPYYTKGPCEILPISALPGLFLIKKKLNKRTQKKYEKYSCALLYHRGTATGAFGAAWHADSVIPFCIEDFNVNNNNL